MSRTQFQRDVPRWKLQSVFFVLGCTQVKTWYEESRLELVVTVLSAANLPHRDNGQYRNPYAKVFLLPDRRCVEQQKELLPFSPTKNSPRGKKASQSHWLTNVSSR